MSEGCFNVEDKRKDCELEFQRIWNRLSAGDQSFNKLRDCTDKNDRRILVIETNMINLIKSMTGLTRSLWGAAGAIGVIGIGFIIWYIQSLIR